MHIIIIHLVKFYQPAYLHKKKTKSEYICLCSNASPLHYYAIRVPRKADRWR